MNVYYEDTIDTIDDMLASERKFLVANDTSFRFFVTSDPRMKAKELAERTTFFTLGTGQLEEYVQYLSYSSQSQHSPFWRQLVRNKAY